MKKQSLVVLSGIPGSGKSTLSRKIYSSLTKQGYDVIICSTDDYFFVGGTYNFDGSKLGLFHKLNLERATKELKEGKTIIVDNTNTRCSEAAPYVKVAVELNIPVYFYRAVGNYKNIHGVPEDRVQAMKNRMEVLTVEKCLEATPIDKPSKMELLEKENKQLKLTVKQFQKSLTNRRKKYDWERDYVPYYEDDFRAST